MLAYACDMGMALFWALGMVRGQGTKSDRLKVDVLAMEKPLDVGVGDGPGVGTQVGEPVASYVGDWEGTGAGHIDVPGVGARCRR